MRIRAPFSYYGGKSKITHVYPTPKHNLIIEPFGGSGAYSWLHREGHNVLINDLDPKTYAIWQFLVKDDALDIVETAVPDTVTAGQRCTELVGGYGVIDPGLLYLCQAEANQGTQGAKGVHDQITSMGAKCWKVKRKMRLVIPAVASWTITNLNYKELPDVEATWFIDPPYANMAGSRYRTGGLDYRALAEWCKSRKGQVIVCENAGADWLPFQALEHRRVSIRSRYQKADAKEVMYYAENLESASGRQEGS